MYRDFSEASKQKLLGLISEVENEKRSDFTDWIGDRWYDFAEWIGKLNIRNYINNVNSYHKKVIDKNNATKTAINRIFRNVSSVNTSYAYIFSNIENSLNKYLNYLDELNDIVTPSNGRFNTNSMSNSFDKILREINSSKVLCLKDQMVQDIDGELVFNEDLIYEYLKKDQAELSIEEQNMLIDVIAQMQDTAAVYETYASLGNDELGADILHQVSWLSDNEKYSSFTAVSAHYSGIYANLLNYIVEQNEESNSFAASLLKISNGKNTLTLLGKEGKEKLDSIFGGTSLKAYAAKYTSEHTEQYFLKLEESDEKSLKSSGEFGKINEHIEEKLKNSNYSFEHSDKKFYDLSGNELTDKEAPDFYNQELTIGELKGNKSVGASIYDGTFDTFGDGNVNVVVGKAEAHASMAAGLYVMGKDGKKKFSPGVNAEIGTSVTALDVEWEQQWLGDEMFGLNSDVELTVGKAEAKANVGVQVYDENGKLDFQVAASAKAEAIAAELEGSAGVNVLGGEVGVSGSVNFGIGAHADVGYKDGVFKFDVGASFGLGASFGAEIDVGGMVDTVCDAASSALDGIKQGWDDFTKVWKLW